MKYEIWLKKKNGKWNEEPERELVEASCKQDARRLAKKLYPDRKLDGEIGCCINAYEHFKQYQVKASSMETFMKEYYKDSRYRARGAEYADGLLKSHKEYLVEWGFDFISHHDSTRGIIVSYYPTDKEKAKIKKSK